MLIFYQFGSISAFPKQAIADKRIEIKLIFCKLYNKTDSKANRTNFLSKPLDKAIHLFYNIKQNKSAEHTCLKYRLRSAKKKRGFIMTHLNSTAKKLPSYESKRSDITLVNYAHRRNMLKQKLYGAAAAIVPVAAVHFAEDVELLLLFIPVGLFLMFTKRSILTFEQE